MRKLLTCAACLALVSAAANAAWVSVKINGFTVDAPKIYGTDCAKPSIGTFAHAGSTAGITKSQLDDANNCVHFDYGGTTYYVHATNVDYPTQVKVDTTACQTAALAADPRHVTQAGMGAGSGCATKN